MTYKFLLIISLTGLAACKPKSGSNAVLEDTGTFGEAISDVVDAITSDEAKDDAPPLVWEDPTFAPQAMDLPVLRLVTENQTPITSKDVYLAAQINLDAGDGSAPLIGSVQVRGRGNSTWLMPKQPYKLKFASKTALLGMPADKEWALLANYSDKSLVRTALAFDLGRSFGAPATPKSRFVELFVNDNYRGTYQLTETVKVAKNRVDISATSFLLEIDYRRDGDQVIDSSLGLPIVVHEPDPATAEQLQALTTALNAAEADLIHTIDVDSFINWYLVQELAKNYDAAGLTSVWFYKPAAGPFTIGPIWDFDIGFGNIDYSECQDPEGWYIGSRFVWYSTLLANPDFKAQVRTRWNAVKASIIDKIPETVDRLATGLSQAQKNNFSRWQTLDKKVWPNRVVTGSYEGEVAELKFWLQRRITWIDAQLNP